MNVIEFSYQVIEMQRRIVELEIENNRLRRYEEDYNNLLASSVSHNATMMNNMLELFMTPGVVTACQEHKTFQEDHDGN